MPDSEPDRVPYASFSGRTEVAAAEGGDPDVKDDVPVDRTAWAGSDHGYGQKIR